MISYGYMWPIMVNILNRFGCVLSVSIYTVYGQNVGEH